MMHDHLINAALIVNENLVLKLEVFAVLSISLNMF